MTCKKKKKIKILAKFKLEVVKSEKPENETEAVALSSRCASVSYFATFSVYAGMFLFPKILYLYV